MTQQIMIETLERAFQPAEKEKTKNYTLAEAVSNNLMAMMPRISPELFERQRTAIVQLSKEQISKINAFYTSMRGENEWNRQVMNPLRTCSAEIPVFAYARVPEQTEINIGKGKITYEDKFEFSTEQSWFKISHDFKELHHVDRWGNKIDTWGWYSENGKGEKLGLTTIEVKSIWVAPFTLDVCVKTPEIPVAIANLGDEALLAYYRVVKDVKKKEMKKAQSSLQRPSLGVLWAPIDETLTCAEAVLPKPPKGDPVLVLDIPDTKRDHRHVIAAWNISEERPFKNWLAEYTD